jgi:hypothetical protein
MADVSLEMLMIAVQRALDDLRVLKESMTRVERYMARSERRDAENLAMQAESRIAHADHSAEITRLNERVERIERRLELRDTP